MKSDILFEHVGHFGVYQFLIFLMAQFFYFFGSSSCYNYIAYRVDYWCDIPELAHLPHENQSMIASPIVGNGEYDQCNVYDLDYSALTPEQIENWEGVPDGTPTRKCQSWIYDDSVYWRTIISEASI